MNIINRVNRVLINAKLRMRLRNRKPSIISCNCIGGVMMHDLGLEFLTPTVNLWFEPKHFIKYVKNLKHYNKVELQEVKDDSYDYPIGRLDDIKIYFQHYPDFSLAKKKWDERKERIDYSNLFVIFVQSEHCTDSDISDFLEIEYPKVIFTNKELNKGTECVYISGFEEVGYLKNVIPYRNWFSGKRYYDDFDYVDWLNKNYKNK